MIDAIQSNKKGIVPRPAGDYSQGSVECDHEKKNVIEKVADAPAVHDREHAAPSMGVTSRKDAVHARTYPGHSVPTQAVKKAEAKPVDRKIIDQQLGLNGHLGN